MAMTAKTLADHPVDISELSDAELVTLVTEKNPAALEVLYTRYSRIVYSFALRIVGDPQIAEELLQEVFFRTWRQGALFRSSRGAFVTWLLSITHNMAIDELRKRNRRPQKADSEEPEALLAAMADTSQDVEEEVWLSSLRSTISEAMQSLPSAQRVTIEMAYFQGLTQREIAERLGEPLGTIKTRMRLGIQKLREQLGDQLGDIIKTSEVQES
jgi:RNA polymerase sigma-70 factor (ECF subfamily)